MKLVYKYWTKAAGIGGFLREPEDFVVREIIEPKFLRKFGNENGKYALFLVKKRNMTTQDAVNALAKLGWRDIGYAGLKDKFSVSWQYMTAIAGQKNYSSGCVEAVPVGKSRKIFPGNLLGNEFVITLHGCAGRKNLPFVIDELRERGMPNYFGLQRFGVNRNNHAIGRHIVKREFEKALDVVNMNSRKTYSSLKRIPKPKLKFFVNAYQSWIFNEALNEYISKNTKPYFKEAAMFGYKTRLGNSAIDKLTGDICRKEGISAEDFRVTPLMLACYGSVRSVFIKPEKVEYSTGNSVKLAFVLPKGSYATVLLREICKSNFESRKT